MTTMEKQARRATLADRERLMALRLAAPRALANMQRALMAGDTPKATVYAEHRTMLHRELARLENALRVAG